MKANTLFPDPKVAALASAIQQCDWSSAENALSDGADLNGVGKDGISPLIWTMYVKNKPAFEWLLDHGTNPNFDSGGADGCALFWAVKADDPDWLKMLLEHKANPNLTHKSCIGLTEPPLMAAVIFSRTANVKMLIAAGADVNYQQSEVEGKSTPAIDASNVGFFEGVYLLLEAGADFRPRTAGGSDLVHKVARYSLTPDDPRYHWRELVLKLLRNRGADVDGAIKDSKDAVERGL